MDKSVFFAGHRDDWRNIGIEDKLEKILRKLINDGCTQFFTGSCGYFDQLCERTIVRLKGDYPHIKLIRVDYQYTACSISDSSYDERYVFGGEYVHYKRKITERNKYLVDKCDILLCNVWQKYKSGAYRTYLYAVKRGKIIINVHDFKA